MFARKNDQLPFHVRAPQLLMKAHLVPAETPTGALLTSGKGSAEPHATCNSKVRSARSPVRRELSQFSGSRSVTSLR